MEASKVLYHFNRDDHLLHRLDVLHTRLKELAAVIEENNRVQRYGRPPHYVVHQHQGQRAPKTPRLLFPLNVVAMAIQAMLTRWDQAIGRWVKEGIINRWMQRFFAWQRKRRRV